MIFRIKKDFLRHKTAKMNDKIRRFGVVMTALSRKNVFDHANYSIKSDVAQKLT